MMKKQNEGKFNNNDFKPLNDELGSFNLEPPKIYRKEQEKRLTYKQENSRSKNTNGKKTSSKGKKKKGTSAKQNKTTQQKRKEENQKRKKKILLRKILFSVGVVLLILAVFVVLSLTVLFKIDTITITGNSKYTTQQIESVLPIEKNKNLFLADTSSAEEKLESSLPYIYNAEIDRKMPSTITVKVTETDNIYAIKNKDKTYLLLDNNLKVLESASAKKPKNAVDIKKATVTNAVEGNTAEFTDKQISKDLLALTDAINKLELTEATAIYSDDINNNFIVYENRIVFKLGSCDDLENKLYSALAAVEKLNETNPQAEGEMTVTGDKQVYFTENK
ncbi:MAG: cell division protein FtsQ/DivIB [Eubacterium sp.]